MGAERRFTDRNGLRARRISRRIVTNGYFLRVSGIKSLQRREDNRDQKNRSLRVHWLSSFFTCRYRPPRKETCIIRTTPTVHWRLDISTALDACRPSPFEKGGFEGDLFEGFLSKSDTV